MPAVTATPTGTDLGSGRTRRIARIGAYGLFDGAHGSPYSSSPPTLWHRRTTQRCPTR